MISLAILFVARITNDSRHLYAFYYTFTRVHPRPQAPMRSTFAAYLGHEVSETDGGHGYEDEVERLEESPSLLDAEHNGADDYVPDEHDERHGHGQVELVVNGVHAERRRAWRRGRETRLAIDGPAAAAEYVAGTSELSDVVLHALHDLLEKSRPSDRQHINLYLERRMCIIFYTVHALGGSTFKTQQDFHINIQNEKIYD